MKISQLLRPGMLAQMSSAQLGPDTPPGVFISIEAPMTRYLVFTHRAGSQSTRVAVQLEASATRPAFSYIKLSRPTGLYGIHCGDPAVRLGDPAGLGVYVEQCGWLRLRKKSLSIGCTDPAGFLRVFRIPDFRITARQWLSSHDWYGSDFESYTIGIWVCDRFIPLYQSARVLPFRERYDEQLMPVYPGQNPECSLNLPWSAQNLLQ